MLWAALITRVMTGEASKRAHLVLLLDAQQLLKSCSHIRVIPSLLGLECSHKVALHAVLLEELIGRRHVAHDV